MEVPRTARRNGPRRWRVERGGAGRRRDRAGDAGAEGRVDGRQDDAAAVRSSRDTRAGVRSAAVQGKKPASLRLRVVTEIETVTVPFELGRWICRRGGDALTGGTKVAANFGSRYTADMMCKNKACVWGIVAMGAAGTMVLLAGCGSTARPGGRGW